MFKNLPIQPSKFFPSLSGFFAFILLLVVLFSLLGIIYVQHSVRHMETEYAQLLETQKKQKEVWGKLRLEKNHLSALARVEQIAKNQLKMHLTDAQSEQTQTIKLYLPLSQNLPKKTEAR